MMSLFVTGANGFVGRRLCRAAVARGFPVLAAVRGPSEAAFDEGIKVASLGDITHDVDWMPVLRGIDVVIHAAGRAHVRNSAPGGSLQAFRRVNVEGTWRLAEAAVRAGVERFVFLSSIKVNGESTENRAFTEADPPAPQDSYAVSKWEAEQMLGELSARSGMGLVIVRPPLVYGPGVKGNLLALMRHIDKGYPLPLGSIDNRRTLIALDNLVDALLLVSTAPAAAGETFLVSDGEAVSTADIGRGIASAMGKKARLIRFPEFFLNALMAFAPSFVPAIKRLTGSLVVDNTKIRSVLGWVPRQSFTDGIDGMVQAYCKIKRS